MANAILPTDPVDLGRYGPRERIVQLGEMRLSDAECLALVLRTGQRGECAEQMAHRLLRSYGGLAPLAEASVREIGAEKGIGPARAAALGAAFGIARRLAEVRMRPGSAVRSGRDVATVVRESVRGARRETFFALLLDARRRILSMRVVSQGSADSALVHPREVFSPAVREGASAIVVAHNHPSGNITPSMEDKKITHKLRRCGRDMELPILDHLIITSHDYFSFADEGILDSE
jgi:DNA repair protein RadC